MQDPRMPFSEEIPNLTKPQKKKKASTQKATLSTKTKKSDSVAQASSLPSMSAQKASKRGSANELSPMSHHQTERSNSDSLPESGSGSGNEYRVLRRKYLLLEEESCSIGSDLKGVENEVKTLEDEKNALLDKLVVLEGLIDPPNLHPFSQGKL